MIKFRKITSALYLLIFVIYAVSPIVASVPRDDYFLTGDSVQDVPSARLMILDVLAGEDAGKGVDLRSSESDESDVLLKKKRGILSTKNLLGVVFSASPVLDRHLDCYHIQTDDASKPSYYSALHYFVSGVSPPSLS